MSGPCDFWKFVLSLTLFALIGNEGQCRGDNAQNFGGLSSDNDAGLIPTNLSTAEKAIKTFMSLSLESPSSSSDSSTDDIEERGFENLISLDIYDPLPKNPSPVKKVPAKSFGETLNHVGDKFQAIFPGTRWCGDGNIARDENDFGLFDKTDACCRAHDHCSLAIEAGGVKERLLNSGFFTRSACYCDDAFFKCLQKVNSVVSTKIGKTYFNILSPQCFAYEYPIESCAEYTWYRIFDKKCVKYNFDTSKEKILQWFDNPDYVLLEILKTKVVRSQDTEKRDVSRNYVAQ